MASEGPNSPGTITSDATVGAVAWSNPGNAVASDDSYATATTNGSGQETEYLKCVGFGFSIPTGATINGVLVSVEGKTTNFFGNHKIGDSSRSKLVKAGTITGTGIAPGGDFDVTDSYKNIGSSSNLWGTTLTPEDVNDADFGVAVVIRDGQSSTSETCSIDHVRVTVYYTEAGVPFRRSLLGVGY